MIWTGLVDGALTSKKTYSNYHLTMEQKWGQKKWPPRLNAPRGGGLLYHCYGEHGAFLKAWKRCLEFQLWEGDFGNLFQLGGTSSTISQDGNNVWNPTYPPKPTGGFALHSASMEKPYAQWNRIDLYVVGDSVVYAVNDKVVMALTDAKRHDGTPLDAGQLQIQSEGAEYYIKKLRIRPITKLPKIK